MDDLVEFLDLLIDNPKAAFVVAAFLGAELLIAYWLFSKDRILGTAFFSVFPARHLYSFVWGRR